MLNGTGFQYCRHMPLAVIDSLSIGTAMMAIIFCYGCLWLAVGGGQRSGQTRYAEIYHILGVVKDCT